jgi:adenylosuccinate lyase
MVESSLEARMDYETYQSPFTWRYGSREMRQLWSEAHKRRTWRQLWVALAEVEAEYGLVTAAQARRPAPAHAGGGCAARPGDRSRDPPRPDGRAENLCRASPLGGGILHLGATSTDIEDNADALRMRQSLELVLGKLARLMAALAGKIEQYADTPLMAFTHLQPAEPSTLGYRLAQYGQDLLLDWEALGRARRGLRGKGFKGAVGTGASYAELLGDASKLEAFEAGLSTQIGLPFFPVTTQVSPRKQDYQVSAPWRGWAARCISWLLTCAFCSRPSLASWRSLLAPGRWAPAPCRSSATPSRLKRSTHWRASLAQMPRSGMG